MSAAKTEQGWFSIPDAAKYTGFSIPTIRKALELGHLKKKEVRLVPGARASIRIKREALDKWIEGESEEVKA